jgi:hypothetical protein
MPGLLAAKLVGKRPNAEIRGVVEQRIGRHLLQLAKNSVGKEQTREQKFFHTTFLH